MKKRIFTLGLTILATVILFCLPACTGSGIRSVNNGQTLEEVTGVTNDTGMFEVLIPEGWVGVSATSPLDSYLDPTTLTLYKSDEDELVETSNPFIIINYMDANTTMLSPRTLYDDVENLEDMTFGNYSYTAYTGTSMGFPYTILEAQGDHSDFLITICMKNGGEISLEDADVQAILNSIAITYPEALSESVSGIRSGIEHD